MNATDTDEILRLFLASYKVVTYQLESELTQFRAPSLTEAAVLGQLHRAPEGQMRLLDLASRLLVSKSGMTRIIDRLQQAGYVERQDSEVDKRVTFAVITDKGLEASNYTTGVLDNALSRTFASALTGDEIDQLMELLSKLTSANLAEDESWPPARSGDGETS